MPHDHTSCKRNAGAKAEAFDQAAQPPPEAEQDLPQPKPLPEFVTFGDLLKNPPPEPPLLLAGTDPANPRDGALVHRGDKVMLGAESKAGKTWWMLQQALCIASGLPFLGHQVSQSGLVLYINFELRPWAFARRVRWVAEALGLVDKAGRPNAPANFIGWNLRGAPGGYDIENVTAVALDRLRGQQVAAVFLDPLYKSYGGKEENSATDMAAVLEAMERFSEQLEAAFFIASHFAKGDSSGKAQIDRISGSGVIARDPDAIVTLSKFKDGPKNTYVWESTLRNMACPEARAVEFEFPVWKLRPDLSVGSGQVDLQGLADLLPAEGLNNGEWQKAAVEQGFKLGKDAAWQVAKNAVLEAGLVAEFRQGHSKIFRKAVGKL